VPAFWWFTGFHPDYRHTTDTPEKIGCANMTRILKPAYPMAWQFGIEATPKFGANPGGT
jgi:hypothetical protein